MLARVCCFIGTVHNVVKSASAPSSARARRMRSSEKLDIGSDLPLLAIPPITRGRAITFCTLNMHRLKCVVATCEHFVWSGMIESRVTAATFTTLKGGGYHEFGNFEHVD